MVNKDDLRFQIMALRQDKIIYATEATAASATMLVVIYIFGVHNLFSILAAIFAVGYWLYASLGNLSRFHEIKKLEGQL
jgi:hypothetical protein